MDAVDQPLRYSGKKICNKAKAGTAVAMWILWMSLSTASASSITLCSGEQLNLTCDTATRVTRLRWDVHFPDRSAPETRNIFSVGSDESAAASFSRGQTVFRFSRTSISPLMSLVVIDNVSPGVNGTRVECLDAGGGSLVSTTTIYVIGNAIPKPNIVTNTVEQFATEAVTVFLEWTVQEDILGLVYNISVFPQADIQYNGMENAILSLSYNTPYNVSIVVLCGENLSPTLYTELHYVRCIDPLSLLTEANRRLLNTDYNQTPATEGTNVTFSCNSPQLLFEGPDSAVCMENGEWKPDPRNLSCIQSMTPECIENPSDQGCPSNTETQGMSDSMTTILIIEASSQTGAIVGSVLGVLSAIVLASIAIIIIVVLVYKFRRQKPPLPSSNVQVHHQELEQFASPMGEYSLLQHSGPRTKNVTSTLPSEEGQSLVYADIGPSSRRSRPPISTHSLDDNRVEYAQLNYQNGAKKEKAMDVTVCSVDNTLNLDSLLIQLQSKVTKKWYEFGKAIGVGKEVLEKYLECTPDQSMIEVCDYWFRSHAGQPTWREVANALKKIKFHQLAIDIEMVYETGELPVTSKDTLAVSFPESEEEPPPPIPPRLPL